MEAKIELWYDVEAQDTDQAIINAIKQAATHLSKSELQSLEVGRVEIMDEEYSVEIAYYAEFPDIARNIQITQVGGGN